MLINYETCRIDVIETLVEDLNKILESLYTESSDYVEGFKYAIQLVEKELDNKD